MMDNSCVLTFGLVFRSQDGDRDVIRALLALCIRYCHLEGVHPLLKPTDLQQTWMSHL